MTEPLISICIPTYNGEKYIEQCIQSSIRQTYTNLEIVIIDDCSKDGTWNTVSRFAQQDKRIRIYRNDSNTGLVANWNKCLELSKGEWIKFLFQDDYLGAECISEMVAAITSETKLVVSKRNFVLDEDLDESMKQYYKSEVRTFERVGVNTKSVLPISAEQISSLAGANICLNFIGEPTVAMFSRMICEEVGNFNSDLSQICDLEYFLRIATKYGLTYIPKPLTFFRIHKGSTSSSNIANKTFILRHIETTVMARQLLYSDFYSEFRKSLSGAKKRRLKWYFLIHIYEARTAVKETSAENRNRFEEVCNKYPEIKDQRINKGLMKLVMLVIKWRRGVVE